jgi:hypothetical protein
MTTRHERATRYVNNTLPARSRHLAAGLVAESLTWLEMPLPEFYRELANQVVRSVVKDAPARFAARPMELRP